MNKNTENRKLKIILIAVLSIVLAIGAYIYIPHISYALEFVPNDWNSIVGAISTPANGAETKTQIYEHRGYRIRRYGSGTSWEEAAGNTGIQNISGYLSEYMNDAYDESYGWYYSLAYNSSIFCQQHGKPLPDIWDKYLQMFHVADTDTNNITTTGVTRVDKINYFKNLSDCPTVLEILWRNIEQNTIETIGESVQEKDLNFLSDNMYQYTNVRLKYNASSREFDTIEAYIFTYSNRAQYRNDPAQIATWAYKNGSTANDLYYAAQAVNESLGGKEKPTTPQMTKTTDDSDIKNTGTVIEGNDYKIGPIKMNGYTYRWSSYAKNYSGELICGIIEMKVELDNGTVIMLDSSDDFTYSYEDNSQKTFSLGYSDSPSLHGYIYPSPNSKFFIKIPIASCTGATSVRRITAKYKWTTSDGEGGDLYGKYDKILWESQGITIANENNCSYSCTKCSHTGLSVFGGGDYNKTSHYYSGDIKFGYPNLREHAYWCSDSLSYCKYGSRAGTIYSWSTSIPDGITDSCSWEWACGKYEHTHGDGNCNSKDCGHTHNSRCCSKDEHTHTDSCKDANGKRICGESAHTHGSGCNSRDCYHTHTASCCSKYEHTHYASSCGRTHTCTKNYCKHGHLEGHHEEGNESGWGEAHEDWCSGPEGIGVRCIHNHGLCIDLTWKVIEIIPNVQSQTLIYVKDAQTYEHTEECYIDNIPLVAKVEIDKYVYDVNHSVTDINNLDTTYAASDARKDLEEAVKEANPVYVETDDLVTYKVVLKNSSAFGVKVKADDIMPSCDYEFVSAYLGGETLSNVEALREKTVQINANSEASVMITIKIKENPELSTDNSDVYENKARIITRNGTPKNNDDDIDYIRTVDDDGPVVNHISVTCDGTTTAPEWESSDWIKLNNYNAHIDKYVYQYDQKVQIENNSNSYTDEPSIVGTADGRQNVLKETRMNDSTLTTKVSDGNVEDTVRQDDGVKEAYKKDHPLNAEKGESITYAIKVSNEASTVTKAEASGSKPATQFKPTLVIDTLHEGLKYQSISATIYNSDGSKKKDILSGAVSCTQVGTDGDYNIYNIEADDSVTLNPGEYIIYYMEAKIVQSNMYLYSMENTAKLETISNINNVVVTQRNISKQQTSIEYVRMKDLVIAGQVWLDIDRDGLMNDKARSDLDKINNNINDNAMKKDIVVRLYQVGLSDAENPVRTTLTDENGLYTFGRDENLDYHSSFNYTDQYSDKTIYQRVDKADNKDDNGNYTANSQYLSYYIEYEYDGVLYKSTEIYAGMDNLTGDGKYNEKYLIDSNAAELESERAEFNKRYEYISYNVAYDLNLDKSGDLVFQKDGHQSILIEDASRDMTAKSFVLSGTQTIEYLWLYPFNAAVDNTIPETDYLKHINLGLELREDVDIALTKDLYQIKTTINGEQMEYSFNQNNGINGEMVQSDTNKYLNNYIVRQPYGFEIYESDYKYRIEQYLSQAVQDYKGANGEDELNVEVTFRMTIDNKAVTDDDDIPGATDTQLDVKVHEILDLYDEDFMEVQFNSDGTMKVGDENEVDIKVKDENGYLTDGTLVIGEAWYFKEVDDLSAADKDTGERYAITNIKDQDADGDVDMADADIAGIKPIYAKVDDGKFAKVELTILGKSTRNTAGAFSEKDNTFKADGYNTLYITGMGNEIIHEGEYLDIYVKYVLDKDELEITITDETVYTETEKTKIVETYTDGTVTKNTALSSVTTEKTAKLTKSLKIAENITTPFKQQYGRGTEGIAQVNAYSVWYTDETPASLVDKNSNAGNIGIKNETTDVSAKLSTYKETTTSADDIDFYEDTTYKTGVQIVAEGTENSKESYKDESWFEDAFGSTELELYRDVTGVVWDDTRSETLGTTDNDTQYIGNGLYTADDVKENNARANGNVEENYKDESVTEEKDIAVRNAKAEFIEIVAIPQDDGTVHYYEQVLTDVTWEQVQHIRTDEDGRYTLKGLKPGNYIIRFTYGDTVEDNVLSGTYNSTLQKQYDMLIFNGQDYKSTQYTIQLADGETDVDTIIAALEEETYSDARDDEVRRLEVNTYSEVMTNNIAEILKGVANGTSLTPNSYANSTAELQALTDNTYMVAETVEFLVKAEKLTNDQTQVYKSASGTGSINTLTDMIYQELEEIKNRFITERDFTIENVDFGIEYRPESEISLLKEISEISLTTEDNEILVDLFFYTEETGNGKITHHIDKEKSKGFDLVQFISNDYNGKTLLNNLISEEDIQGLVYVQVDQEILQGCTVEITYSFDAQNNSEVDRISTNLDDIRYKANEATTKLIEEYRAKGVEIANSDKYTASNTGRNIIYKDTYDKDDNGYIYRNMKKTTTTDGSDGYFGRYVGYAYYTGELSDLDTISSLKFDKILDYVDKGLDYLGSTTQTELVNKFWAKTTTAELVDYVYQLSDYRPINLTDDEIAAGITVPELTDVDGYEYSSLVLSVDDRIKDEDEPNPQANVKNVELSRFLKPKVTVVGNLLGTTDVIEVSDADKRLYSGTILLEVSRVLSANTADDDMTYENIAEIVQFTTLNGRRTNFATTIGNADIHRTQDYLDNPEKYDGKYTDTEIRTEYGSVEYITARLEPDTSATETVTLIPPTGIMQSRRAIVNAIRTATTGVEVVSITGLVAAVIAGFVLLILFLIRKYKKRRIK